MCLGIEELRVSRPMTGSWAAGTTFRLAVRLAEGIINEDFGGFFRKRGGCKEVPKSVKRFSLSVGRRISSFYLATGWCASSKGPTGLELQL